MTSLVSSSPSLIGNMHSMASLFNEEAHASIGKLRGGLLYIGELGANCAYDVYNLSSDGFDKWTKAAIINLKVIAIFFDLDNLFKGCLGALNGHKDLIYASKFIGATLELQFVVRQKKRDENNNLILDAQGKPIEEIRFKWPDKVKVLSAIASYLDFGKFVHKNVFEFTALSQLATRIGSYQVSFLGMRIEEIRVVGTLCSSPKDFFIFIASFIEIKRLLEWEDSEPSKRGLLTKMREAAPGQRLQTLWNNLTIPLLLKFASSMGKMILIAFGRTSSQMAWFTGVDFITQNASLIKFFIDRHDGRMKRLNKPGA